MTNTEEGNEEWMILGRHCASMASVAFQCGQFMSADEQGLCLRCRAALKRGLIDRQSQKPVTTMGNMLHKDASRKFSSSLFTR